VPYVLSKTKAQYAKKTHRTVRHIVKKTQYGIPKTQYAKKAHRTIRRSAKKIQYDNNSKKHAKTVHVRHMYDKHKCYTEHPVSL
jgi:hypothetical protein